MTETAIQRAPTGMELLAELSRKVSDPQAAVELAKQIVELQTRQESLRQSYERFEWEKLDREARVEFAEAFGHFKEDAPKILKTKHVNFPNKSGGQTDYWHVELDKACDLLIPALLKVGITHQWKSADLPDGRVRVTCLLRHRLGHEYEGASLAGPADQSGGKNPIQGVGSSTSYLERYTFLATCGIVPTGVDNDGQPEIAMEGFDEYLKAIKEASTVPNLKEAHIAAVKASMKAFDKAANDKFNEAKNDRFGEINRGEI
jgi:hypothetical protein